MCHFSGSNLELNNDDEIYLPIHDLLVIATISSVIMQLDGTIKFIVNTHQSMTKWGKLLYFSSRFLHLGKIVLFVFSKIISNGLQHKN